jgi:hypothetical protein
VQIPQLHGIDLLGIRIAALGLFVHIGDRRHARIELRLEDRCELLVDIGRLQAIELAFLVVTALDDVDALLGLGLEEVDAAGSTRWW